MIHAPVEVAKNIKSVTALNRTINKGKAQFVEAWAELYQVVIELCPASLRRRRSSIFLLVIISGQL